MKSISGITPQACTLLILVVLLGSTAYGAGIQNFDTAGAHYTLTNLAGPAAAVLPAGPDGNFLRLAYSGFNDTLNSIGFESDGSGAFSTFAVEFDARMGEGRRADGLGFSFLNTNFFGKSGSGGHVTEAANRRGSVGVGFDIYRNDGEPSNNHVSVSFDSVPRGMVAVDPGVLDLASGAFNHFLIMLAAGGEGVRVTVRITPPGGPALTVFESFLLEGVDAYEGRIAFGARTGAATANHDIDNIEWTINGAAEVPEPSTWFLTAFAIAILGVRWAGRRRSARGR